MPVTIRIQPLIRDVEVMLGDLQGMAASQLLAAFADEEITKAKQINARALGRVPPYKVFVDGQEGAALESVKPTGVIVAEFELTSDILFWISQQLIKLSPVKSGRYQKSHILFADGVEIGHLDQLPPVVPAADEYVFINVVPYARKIERGSSSQAPDGVYQGVATLANARSRAIARTIFSYRTLPGGERNPAVVVLPNK